MDLSKFLLNRKIEEYKKSERFIRNLQKFKETFNNTDKYKAKTLIKWHFLLTGSCPEGREKFIKDNNIDLEKEVTIKEFIEASRDKFGWDVIKELEEIYK